MGIFDSKSKTETQTTQNTTGSQTQQGDPIALGATGFGQAGFARTNVGNPASVNIKGSLGTTVKVDSVDFGAVSGGLDIARSAVLSGAENQREILGTAERLVNGNNEIFADVVESLNSARSGAVDSLASVIDGSTVAELRQSDVIQDAIKTMRWPLFVAAGAYAVYVFRGARA